MNKLKKAMICGLVVSAITPTALAKCPNTYENINIQRITSIQQLINYLNSMYGTKPDPASGGSAQGMPTAAPGPTNAPASKPTSAPIAKPTARPTAAPTAMPTAAPTEASMVEVNASANEKQVFELVNKIRAQNGLSRLKWADDLAALARAHSRDMINRRFFSHNNPDGLSPFDRMKAAGISYRTAAENIAYGQKTPEAVMNAWMNSSGHRANILNANVKEIGVGAVADKSGTIYWTQEFVAR